MRRVKQPLTLVSQCAELATAIASLLNFQSFFNTIHEAQYMPIHCNTHEGDKEKLPGSVELLVEPDRCGYLTVSLTDDSHNEGKRDPNGPDDIFIQAEQAIAEFWNDVNEGASLKEECDRGWDVTVLMGIDMWGQYQETFSYSDLLS